MATQVGWVDRTGHKTLKSTAAITQYSVVKVGGSGQCTACGVGEAGIGVALTAATASLEYIDVKLWSAAGTFPGITASAVAAGAVLYTAAAGAINDATTTASGGILGIALTAGASTAGGDVIEYTLPGPIATT